MSEGPDAARDGLQDFIDLVQQWAFAVGMVIAAAALFHQPMLLGSEPVGKAASVLILFAAFLFFFLTGKQYLKRRKLERKSLLATVVISSVLAAMLTTCAIALLFGAARYGDAQELTRREAQAAACKEGTSAPLAR